MDNIDLTVKFFESGVGEGTDIREYCTIRNSLIGSNCKVYERVSIKKATIGSGSDINAGSYVENAEIGERVMIAPNCIIVGVTHEFSRDVINHDDVFVRIIIGDGAWIGAGSIIMPGVTIGKNSVVGAGAIVKCDVPDNHRYVGTPLQFRLDSIS